MKYRIQKLNDQGTYDEYESCHNSDELAILDLVSHSYDQIDLISVLEMFSHLPEFHFTYLECEGDIVNITGHHKIIDGLVSRREMEFYTLRVKEVIIGVVQPIK